MNGREETANASLDVRRVLFEYKALSDYELSLTKDDLVVIEGQVDENSEVYWTHGRLALTQTKGLVPINYLSSPLRGVKNEVEAVCLNLALTKGVEGLKGKFDQKFDQKTNDYVYEYYEEDTDDQFAINQSINQAGLGLSRLDEEFYSDDSFTDTDDEEGELSTSAENKQTAVEQPSSLSFEEVKIAKVTSDHRCSAEEFQLSVKKGDFVTVFPEDGSNSTTNSDFMMVAERKHPFDMGYVPKQKLASVPELRKQPWYLGCVGSPISDSLLKGPGIKDLTFLVRDSEGPQKGYVICVRSKGHIKYKKLPDTGHGFKLVQEYQFGSLVELVDFHVTCSTPSYRLGIPFNKYADRWRENIPPRENVSVIENKSQNTENPLLNRLEDELRSKQAWTTFSTGMKSDFFAQLNSKLTLSEMVQLQLNSLGTKAIKENKTENVNLRNSNPQEIPGSVRQRPQSSLNSSSIIDKDRFVSSTNIVPKANFGNIIDNNIEPNEQQKKINNVLLLQTQLQSRLNLGMQESNNTNQQIDQLNWSQSANVATAAISMYPPTAPQIPPPVPAVQRRVEMSSNIQVTTQGRNHPITQQQPGSLARSDLKSTTSSAVKYPNLQDTENISGNVKQAGLNLQSSTGPTVSNPNLQDTQNRGKKVKNTGSIWKSLTSSAPNKTKINTIGGNVKLAESEKKTSTTPTVKYPNLQNFSSSNNSSDGFGSTSGSKESKEKDKSNKSRSITSNIKKRYDHLFDDSKTTKNQKVNAKELKANIKEEWQIEPKDITLNDLIGSGFYGEVYKGDWKGYREKVAVKTFKSSKMSANDFYIEANSMMRLRHPNLVKLFGVCVSKESCFLVMEYHQTGSILDYVKSGKVLLKMDFERIGYEVASGMDYLGKCGFIHRDLSARNVLVDSDLHAKIADFGLARSVKDLKIEAKDELKMPWKWTAPEAFENPPKWSPASDVWSFGIFLWEMYSDGAHPYEDITTRAILMIYLNAGRFLLRPEKCPLSLYQNIMLKCWKLNEKERLTFQVIKVLYHSTMSKVVPF